MPPPKSIEQLMHRARSIAGLRLGHLADQQGQPVPDDLRRHKGWIGRLLEERLGADAGNASRADFSKLGVELKTIPVDRHGGPRESTFVCSAPLARPDETTWESSRVRAKLAEVLWIPIFSDADIAVGERMIGSPLLWTPTPAQASLLARDWCDHLDVIRRGYVDHITAHDGEALQLRPKGASAQSRTWSVGPDGQSILTLPRAFYLRTSFTRQILRANFAIG